MKCVFQFWSCTPHLEASLEIAINEAVLGNDVTYFWGGDDVLFSENNSQGKFGQTFLSQKPIFKAMRLIREQFGDIFGFKSSWIDFDLNQDLELSFNSSEELRKIKFEDYYVGTAALSSLSHIFLADLTKHNISQFRPMLEEVMFSGIGVYQSALKILTLCHADQVYLFNGRFVHEAAVHAAALKLGIPVSFHERGSSLEKYSLTPFLVHDRRGHFQKAQEMWLEEVAKDYSVVEKTHKYMDQRIEEGVAGGWKNFSKSFDRGMEEKDMRGIIGITTQKYWVYFQSSDDEYSAIPPWLRDKVEWTSQEQIVEFLASQLPLDTSLIVRLHPNMCDKNKDNLQSWKKLETSSLGNDKRVRFVWHNSTINSYLLAKNAEKVLSHGSSIGAEAIYMGKESICCGTALWSEVEGAKCVMNFAELQEALETDCPVSPESVLPIAHYWLKRGEPYRYYKSTGIYSGKFFDVDLFNDARYL